MNEADKYTSIAWSKIVANDVGKWVPEIAVEVLNVSKFGKNEIAIVAKFLPRERLSMDSIYLRFDSDSGMDGVPKGEMLRITGEIEMIGAHDAELIHCEVIGRIDARPDQVASPGLQSP